MTPTDCNHHSKAAGDLKADGFALAPQTMLLRQQTGHRRGFRTWEEERTRSDPAIIHPRFAAWYKLGNENVSLIAQMELR